MLGMFNILMSFNVQSYVNKYWFLLHALLFWRKRLYLIVELHSANTALIILQEALNNYLWHLKYK